jgi:hypothetical protein
MRVSIPIPRRDRISQDERRHLQALTRSNRDNADGFANFGGKRNDCVLSTAAIRVAAVAPLIWTME